MPVEATVQRLMAAIPAAHSPEAFQALGAATQALKDGLARAGELRALAGAPAAGDGPLPELAAALATRRLTLATPADAATWPPELRRPVLVLGLAAAELAEAGSGVTLALEARDGRRRLTATVAAGSRVGRGEGIALTLARRVVEAAGGTLTLAVEEGRGTLAADLPPARRTGASEDIALRA